MGDGRDMFRGVARWSGLVGSFLVFVLGIVHLTSRNAKLRWPDQFKNDINKTLWREPLFTFVPDSFADIWTPFFFGLVGTLWHFHKFAFEPVMKSFGSYFLFMFCMALFACIGYNGGLGILFVIPVLLSALFSLIVFFWEDSGASLELDSRFQSAAR